MSLALATCAKLPFGFKARALINLSRRDLPCHSFSGSPRSLHRQAPTLCSIKASAGKHISYVNEFSSYLHDLAGRILDASPQPIKEFPWKKSKLVLGERIFVLGKNVLAWSLIALVICNILYDTLMAGFMSRELVVPLGLFIGVSLADFLNESCLELFQIKAKGGNDMQQLWGIGLFFIVLRFIFLRFRIAGWMLFCHIGNGGLMQILWLAKEMKQAEILQNKEEVDALPPSGH